MSDEIKEAQIGDHIIFVDPSGYDHNALVICRWNNALVNLVRVSDEGHEDSYGRQIERPTSIPHKSVSNTHGFHWRWPDEEKVPLTQPEAV